MPWPVIATSDRLPFSKNEVFRCCYFNAQSVVNKLCELHNILYTNSSDCIFITESWLHDSISNGLLDPKTEYNVYRKDRDGKRGGGICALINKSICVLPVDLTNKYANLEVVCLDFINTKPYLRAFIVYRPPKYDLDAVAYIKLLIDCITEFTNNSKRIHLIIGDFNVPNINWNSHCSSSDQISDTLLQFIVNHGFSQLIQFPTRGLNILDVLFVDVDNLVTSVSPLPPIGFSDHNGIAFTVDIKSSDMKPNTVYNENVCKFRWYHADFQSMSNYLSCIDWTAVLYANPSAADGWNVFMSLLWHTINMYVPTLQSVSTKKQSCKLSRPRKTRKCEAKRRQIWKQLMKAPHDSLLRGKYRSCTHIWRNLVHENEVLTEKHIIEANNLGTFYRYINKRITNRTRVGVIVDECGYPVTDEYEKANIFNRYFASVCVADNDVTPQCNDIALTSVLENVCISDTDVLRSINKLKSNTSSGPDALPPVLIKSLKHCLCKPLAIAYTQLISVGMVPEIWHDAYIVPVFKKGAAGDVANYRPISLTCVLSKVLERIIANKIHDHLQFNNILNKSQHGFIRRRSTYTNMLECVNDWTICLQSQHQVAVIYIDFSKAFDVVSHKKLFQKLHLYGIRGALLLWIQNFFTGRTHHTRIGSMVSDTAQLTSGVVQGSGIGPLMFLIYVNELIDILEQHGIKVKMFADDAKMYLRITDDADVARLQQAVDALVNWASLWQLSISVNKCCLLNIGKLMCNTSIDINGAVLPSVEHTRDLGVEMSSDLSPTRHVGDIVAKGHKRATLIHRAFVSRDVNTLLRAFLVYVRPLLEYGSIIWSPHNIKDITAIESVQRRFTKRLPGFNKLCYRDRLQRLNIPSLELRRLHTDLIWCYKIVFDMVDVRFDEFFEWSPSCGTRGHKYKLYKKSVSTRVRSEFFTERVVNVWNGLPEDRTDFNSLVGFKNSILACDWSSYLKCF